MAIVAQLVRALDCGSKCRGFEPRRSPIFIRECLLNWIQAIILGLVQGLTEFLPVSSSAHLKIAKKFLSVSDGEHLLFFDLVCHAGTLLALIIYLRRDIWAVLKSLRQIALFSLAIAPLVPAYFLLKPLRVAASDPAYLGYCLILTSGLLFMAARRKVLLAGAAADADASLTEAAANPYKKYLDVLCIGLAQACALIPGISRSGATIAAARFRGWKWMEAAKFSFLLAVPTILGGQLLETAKLAQELSQELNRSHSDAAAGVSLGCYGAGFLAAFGLGLLSVRLVFWVYEKGKVRPFAWYCLGVGLLAIGIFRNG